MYFLITLHCYVIITDFCGYGTTLEDGFSSLAYVTELSEQLTSTTRSEEYIPVGEYLHSKGMNVISN
jgi:hypothetical protein